MRRFLPRWVSTAFLAAIMLGGFSKTATAGLLSNWTWSSTITSVNVAGGASFSVGADTTGAGGYDLTIVVDNTANQLPTSTAQILTGLYFDISGFTGALSMYSATADLGMLESGSAQNTPTAGTANTPMCAKGAGENALAPNSTNCTVSGGWESAYNSSGIGGGAAAKQHYGLGTSGQTGIFHGNDVGTFDYGVAPGGTVGINPANGGGLSGAYPPGYVYGEAVFVLTGLTTQNITIQNVSGAYGTAPEGTPAATNMTTALPEPSSVTMLLAGVMLLAMTSRMRRRA